MNTDQNETEPMPDASEHPEMDRASAEVAALVTPLEHGPEGEEATGEEEPPHPDLAVAIAEMETKGQSQDARNCDVVFAALCRLSRLMGGPMVGEHTGDIDTTGLSPEFTSVVDWAKTARIA